ncbi:MAG: SGNH/GDSL hydrolase family protein [Armatimonadetes bacterium]|nr:SGNH/GDSL hydrolase family protein [Armatimonadota bacterium]
MLSGLYPVFEPAAASVTPGSLNSENRPPSASDNASRGYTSTSEIWQYGGRFYQPVATPDATSAAWAPVQTPAGTWVDIVTAMPSGSVAAAYGLFAIKSGFTGPCIDISVTINSTPTAFTINILTGGKLDTSALGAAMVRADAGSKVTVTKWYDQNGTNHATSGTNTLFIDWDPVLGMYALFGETSTMTARNLVIPNTVSVNSRQCSFWAMGRGVVACGKTSPVVGCLGNWNGGTGPLLFIGNEYTSSPETSKPTLAAWQTGQNYRTPSTMVPLDCGLCVVGVVPSASNTTFWCNEDTGVNATAPTSATLTGGAIGTNTVGADRYASMRFVAVMVTQTTALTSAVQQQLRYAAYLQLGIMPQVKDRVVFIGDSRTQGFIAAQADTLPMAVVERLTRSAKVHNCGNSGWGNTHFTTGSPSTLGAVNTLYNSTRKNIAVVWLGVNDFLVSNLATDQAFTALTANIATLKAQGWTVLLVNEAATTSTVNSTNTKLATLRGLIAAGGHGADELIELGGLTPYLAASNTAYYPDGLHGSTALYHMMASRIAERLDYWLGL